jgi:hypothetical protein
MFSKLKTLKKFTKEIVDINELIKLVSNNQQKELIDKIRSVEYKSKEYKDLKLNVNCITPHGTFNSLCNNGLISLSGYLYYDIDGFDTEIELNDTKNKLIDTGIVSFICKSVGGKGLSFMVKVNDTINISSDTFTDLYSYVRSIFIDKGYNIDLSANGLVRKMIISSDENVYLNNKVSLLVDEVSFKIYQESLTKVKNIKLEGNRGIRSNDTFVYNLFNLINKEDLILIEETQYDINNNYNIEEIDYYKIFIPKEIKDGDKHRIYVRIMNALYYLNKNITMNEIYSYLYYINEKSNNKMNDFYLRKYTFNICSGIEKNGIKIKLRNKKIHINNKFNKNEKRAMGGKINAKIRQNNSLRLIEEARMKCASMNEIPTQKRIQEMTGLGIATIKRNWNKEYNDLTDIKIVKIDNNEKQLERDYKLSQLIEVGQDLFFEKETEIIKYKNFKEVEIEKISQEDKKLFISKINDLKEIGIEPSESIMIELNIFQQEKTWYMYDKWTKNKNKK